MIKRSILTEITQQLRRKKSLLLLGPRQVGKTTLIKTLSFDLHINFALSRERLLYEKDPDLLQQKIQTLKKQKKIKFPLVYIDEFQLVPPIMNEIQVLIDEKEAQFILTGSSARKLKESSQINLAPGRFLNLRLDPFSITEYDIDLNHILVYGQLPEVVLEHEDVQKIKILQSYVENYIEEEIRKETKIRNIANYARFIELAAMSSGEICNFSSISKELGPTVMTIQSYFQVLEDTLFVDRIDPYLKNATRKKLTKSSKYLFYDLGVRRVCDKESTHFTPDKKGKLFEHLVGNEILKWIHEHNIDAKLYFWRDSDGPEVDWIIEYKNQILPIEVKLKNKIASSDLKHLKVFLSEYKEAKKAIIVNPSDLFYDIDDRILHIGFSQLINFLNDYFKVK
jgi:predicted AAA+ superfamily ATPase